MLKGVIIALFVPNTTFKLLYIQSTISTDGGLHVTLHSGKFRNVTPCTCLHVYSSLITDSVLFAVTCGIPGLVKFTVV